MKISFNKKVKSGAWQERETVNSFHFFQYSQCMMFRFNVKTGIDIKGNKLYIISFKMGNYTKKENLPQNWQ